MVFTLSILSSHLISSLTPVIYDVAHIVTHIADLQIVKKSSILTLKAMTIVLKLDRLYSYTYAGGRKYHTVLPL